MGQRARRPSSASPTGSASCIRTIARSSGRFDRVVSIGMLEHVGMRHTATLFRRIKRAPARRRRGAGPLDRPDAAGPASTNAWIRKYIFPGGYIPALSEVLPAIERSGLWVTDIEILRLHYAQTLRQWRERFLANWDRAAALYDERFCRMWEYYLAASEVFFRYLDSMNFQIQLARKRDAVPLTRDYLLAAERALAAQDALATSPRPLERPDPAT